MIRIFSIISLLFISNLSLSAADSLKGQLLFLNGDTLSADILEIKPESIKIKHPYFEEESVVNTANILEVRLDNKGGIKKAEDQDDEAKDLTTIRIKPRYKASNQMDTIKGSLSQNGVDFISIDTDYAGLLKIQKSKILTVDIDTHSSLHYSGPKSLEEWKNNLHNESWSFKNSALYSTENSGNIAQEINMPDSLAFSFDLEWKNTAYLAVKFFSDDHKMSRPDNYYEFALRNGYIYITKFTDGSSRRINEDQRLKQNNNALRRALTDEKSAHFDIYLDKHKGVIHIFMNGTFQKSYIDPEPTPKKLGKALHLVSGDSSPIKLTNIRMSQWSGNMPSKNDANAFEELKGEGQRILLKNGDAIIGKTGKIQGGLMAIETEYGPLKLKIKGMRTIDLSEAPEDAPKMFKGDIKLHYNDGGWIIVKPLSIVGSKLKAYHQAFGESEFNLKAFKRIDLHIYNPLYNKARKSDSW